MLLINVEPRYLLSLYLSLAQRCSTMMFLQDRRDSDCLIEDVITDIYYEPKSSTEEGESESWGSAWLVIARGSAWQCGAVSRRRPGT